MALPVEGKEEKGVELIRPKSGNPYKNKNAAKAAIKKAGNDPEMYDITPVEGGFVGRPIPTIAQKQRGSTRK